MSKHNNNNNNDNKKIVETTANENEINLDELLDQYDEAPEAAEANTEETVNNENTQEESNMNNNNNTQVQNTQAQETSKKEKVISVFKGVAKYGSIVVAAGAAGWFGHKYLSKDASDEPTAEQAFL